MSYVRPQSMKMEGSLYTVLSRLVIPAHAGRESRFVPQRISLDTAFAGMT